MYKHLDDVLFSIPVYTEFGTIHTYSTGLIVCVEHMHALCGVRTIHLGELLY